MSEILGRQPLLETVAGIPVWMVGAIAAAVIVVFCLMVFRHGRERMTGGIGPIALLLIAAGVTWILLDNSARRDLAAERLALDARANQLTAHAVMPGSALACLDGAAGETVEASCEKALFATPEATAAAVSFVSAQLALLNDAATFARRDPGYKEVPARLRHAAETDRFGIVAHVLAARDGCTADQCGSFALLNDASRVSTNLANQTYELYVTRYAATWPAAAESPVAMRSPSAAPAVASIPTATGAAGGPAVAPAIGLRVPGPNVFFPSAASIPPVNIMTAEPPGQAPAPPETTGATPAPRPAPAQRRAAAPARRSPPPAETAPVDISPNAQRAAPPPAQ